MAESEKLLLTMLEQLRDDIATERETERASRARLHERMDEVVDRVGRIEGDVRILGQVDGQVRQEVQDLSATVTKNQNEAQPTIDEWKRIRAIGIGFAGILAIGGVSVGAMAVYAGETLVNAIRHWLRIP